MGKLGQTAIRRPRLADFATSNSAPGDPTKRSEDSRKSGRRNHFEEMTKPSGNRMGVHLEPKEMAQRRQEASMNHSIHSADRATHMKIVVMALVAGIAVAGFAISARPSADYSQSARVMKAGKAVVLTSSDSSVVR
jgi:hypothetical protein